MSNTPNRQAPPPAPAAATPEAAPVLDSNALLAAAIAKMTEVMAQNADLAQQNAKFNELLVKNAPRRRKTMAEYLAKNPRKRLLHQTFQNGREVNPKGLSEETIKKLDTIAPGLYAQGLIEVERRTRGINGRDTMILIRYNNKHDSDRSNFYMQFRTFREMVDVIISEMEQKKIAPIHDEAAAPIVPEFPDEL
jgi:hypothetical protein